MSQNHLRAYNDVFPLLKEWNIIPKVIDKDILWSYITENGVYIEIKYTNKQHASINIADFRKILLLRRPISVKLYHQDGTPVQSRPKSSFFAKANEIIANVKNKKKQKEKLSKRELRRRMKIDPMTIIYDYTELQTINDNDKI